MLIGYVRVSTAEQNSARQEVLMQSLGVEKVYLDKASGKNTNRPQLCEMLRFARQGDTVVVESISRFARNTRDLLELMEQLNAKGIGFVSKKEAIDTTTPTGKFMLTIMPLWQNWSVNISCSARKKVLLLPNRTENTRAANPSTGRNFSMFWRNTEKEI